MNEQKPSDSHAEETSSLVADGKSVTKEEVVNMAKDGENTTTEPVETIEEYKAKLQKVEAERDNYKQATLLSKKKSLFITPNKKEEEMEDLDEDELEDIESKLASEKQGISEFLKDSNNEQFIEDGWNDLLVYYQQPKAINKKSVKQALENAKILKMNAEGVLMTKEQVDKIVSKANITKSLKEVGTAGDRGESPKNKEILDTTSRDAMASKMGLTPGVTSIMRGK